MKTFYDVLGVQFDASQDEIKKAFRRLSFKFHPDIGEELDSAKFDEVTKAFKAIGDPKRRAEYDQQLAKNPIDDLTKQVKEITAEFFSRL